MMAARNGMFKNIPLVTVSRYCSTSNSEISPVLTNRNPRNMERMRIAYKPQGYHLEKPGRCFWHKLKLTVTGRYATATVEHFENGAVLSASTQEWAIKKQLYRAKDTTAFINLGRIFAQRCLESGLIEMRCDIEPPTENGKIASFLKAVKEGGVQLTEPEQFFAIRPWHQHRPEKPWEVTE